MNKRYFAAMQLALSSVLLFSPIAAKADTTEGPSLQRSATESRDYISPAGMVRLDLSAAQKERFLKISEQFHATQAEEIRRYHKELLEVLTPDQRITFEDAWKKHSTPPSGTAFPSADNK